MSHQSVTLGSARQNKALVSTAEAAPSAMPSLTLARHRLCGRTSFLAVGISRLIAWLTAPFAR